MDRWLPAKKRQENLQFCLSNSNIEPRICWGSAEKGWKIRGMPRSDLATTIGNLVLHQSGPSTFVRQASRCLSRTRRNVLSIRFCHS